jgi:hypothetical protein
VWGIGAGRGSAEAVLAGSLLGIGCPPWYVIMLKDLMFSLCILYCCSMYILVINWIIPNRNEKSLFVCIQVDFNCNYGEVLSAYEDSCFWFYYSLFTNVNSVTDIHPETANGKKEFWSSLAPLPLEVVLSAGQRAKEQPSSKSQNGFSGNGKFICR